MSKGRILYSYTAVESDEMSVKVGDFVDLISLNEDGWWLAKLNELIGLIPSNFVCLEQQSLKADIENHPVKSVPQKSNAGQDLKRIKEQRIKADVKIESIRNALSSFENSPLQGPMFYDSSPERTVSTVQVPKKKGQLLSQHQPTVLVCEVSSSDRTEAVKSGFLANISQLIQSQSTSNLDTMEQRLLKQLNHILVQHSKDHQHLQGLQPNKSDLQLDALLGNQVGELLPSVENDSKNAIISPQLPQLPETEFHVANSVIDGRKKALPSKLANQDFQIETENIKEKKLPIINASIAKHPPSVPLFNTAPEIVEGIRYPQCRSIVYRPSDYLESNSDHELPRKKLNLQYVYGYDGDNGRHADSIRGKNIVLLSTKTIIYPVAAVAVVMNISLSKQFIFFGHSEEVTCIAAHPDKITIASGQMGKNGRILIWNSSALMLAKNSSSESCVMSELFMSNQGEIRGVFALNFSGDGRFLVALGLDDGHSMVVYDWASGIAVASAKVGNLDVYQIGFNPFLYTPIDKVDDHQIHSLSSPRQESSSDQSTESGCYTLISCGGKQVKFWTLKRLLLQQDSDAIGSTGPGHAKSFKGRQLPAHRHKSAYSVKYELVGGVGVLPKKHGTDVPEFMCFCCINDDQQISLSPVKANKKISRIFTGTSTGSIFIWHHFEEDREIGGMSWQSKGRLISVVMDVHDHPIIDIDYFGTMTATNDFVERIATSSKDGCISVWNVNRRGDEHSLPIESENTVNLADSSDLSLGYCRAIIWDADASSLIAGTTQNCILEIKGVGIDADYRSETDENTVVDVLPIVRGHSGKVRRIALHTSQPIFVTVSSDRSVRLWNGNTKKQMDLLRLHERPTCVAFASEETILVGNEIGEIFLYASKVLTEQMKIGSWKYGEEHRFHLVLKKNVGAKVTHKYEGSKQSKGRPSEVMDIKYSPNRLHVAIGCRDNLIHILSLENSYKRVAVCRGHTSYVRSIDFSLDGLVLQSVDAARELLYWETASGKQINNAHKLRDMKWATWTCLYGWPMQGIFNGNDRTYLEGEINAVCRSNKGELLATGGSSTVDNVIKLFKFPSLPHALPRTYGGHASPVLDIAFLFDDSAVISAGGNDTSIFQWQVID